MSPHRNYEWHDPSNPNCKYTTSIGVASPDADWCSCPSPSTAADDLDDPVGDLETRISAADEPVRQGARMRNRPGFQLGTTQDGGRVVDIFTATWQFTIVWAKGRRNRFGVQEPFYVTLQRWSDLRNKENA